MKFTIQANNFILPFLDVDIECYIDIKYDTDIAGGCQIEDFRLEPSDKNAPFLEYMDLTTIVLTWKYFFDIANEEAVKGHLNTEHAAAVNAVWEEIEQLVKEDFANNRIFNAEINWD